MACSYSNMITQNNSTIRASNTKIIGNNSEIYGDNNIIIGNNNDIFGDSNTITGNNNDITGDDNQVTGNNNDINGANCSANGNNNDYESTIKEETFICSGSSGIEYTGSTPAEAVAKMKAGERKRFQEEERKIAEIKKTESRRWKIDMINLTDEEYKELEEYMEEIKPLWQTW